jgi:hypothetical protein
MLGTICNANKKPRLHTGAGLPQILRLTLAGVGICLLGIVFYKIIMPAAGYPVLRRDALRFPALRPLR